jgi:predicted nucleic acid-binding Zn ribbon protein
MSKKSHIHYVRERVLQEWRGLPSKVAVEEMSSTGEILHKVIQRLGLKKRFQEEEILKAWHEVVGDFLAAHSEPVQLKNATLYVRVIQPTIRYELDRVWKPDILRKLQERFGKKIIRDIKLSF